jgi:hypothetical protein
MSVLSLTVETGACGTLEEAVGECCRLSRLLDINVWCKINGVDVLASPNTDPASLLVSLSRAIASNREIVS